MGVRHEVAAFYFDRAALLLASHIEKAVEKAVDGKTGAAADAASWNAIAPYINAQQKFASPTAGHF